MHTIPRSRGEAGRPKGRTGIALGFTLCARSGHVSPGRLVLQWDSGRRQSKGAWLSSPRRHKRPHGLRNHFAFHCFAGGMRPRVVIITSSSLPRRRRDREKSPGERFALNDGFEEIKNELLLVARKILDGLDAQFNFAFRARLRFHRFCSEQFIRCRPQNTGGLFDETGGRIRAAPFIVIDHFDGKPGLVGKEGLCQPFLFSQG